MKRLGKTTMDHCNLPCGDGHRIHVTLAGAVNGIPLVMFHGGPGSGSGRHMLAPVDLRRFRVVMIDQRGSGRSRPMGRLNRNLTAWLIRDVETVRRHLKIPAWYVLGGSWGATLAIAYAGMHSSVVRGLILRGTFLATEHEIRGLLNASRHRAPQAWLRLYRASDADRPSVLLSAAHVQLKRGGAAARETAGAYAALEQAVLARADRTMGRRARRLSGLESRRQCAKYLIQTHYLRQGCGLRPASLSELARRVHEGGINVTAVHGRRDPLCPPENLAWLRRHMPAMHAVLVDAGHLGSEPGMIRALADALNEMV